VSDNWVSSGLARRIVRLELFVCLTQLLVHQQWKQGRWNRIIDLVSLFPRGPGSRVPENGGQVRSDQSHGY
jgi:hypothetical protein